MKNKKKYIVFILVLLFVSCQRVDIESVSHSISPSVVSSHDMSNKSQAESVLSTPPQGRGISTMQEITDDYRQYLMNVELAVIIQESYASFVSESHERYSYTIRVPLELEIEWPTMFEAGNQLGDYSKIADLIICVQLREGEEFLDAYNIENSFFAQEGDYSQIDKGYYQGSLGNMIYYAVIKYSGTGEYGGGEYKYSYSFLVELEEDIGACVTFYSTNSNRAEAEAYYRSIVETVQKA